MSAQSILNTMVKTKLLHDAHGKTRHAGAKTAGELGVLLPIMGSGAQLGEADPPFSEAGEGVGKGSKSLNSSSPLCPPLGWEHVRGGVRGRKENP